MSSAKCYLTTTRANIIFLIEHIQPGSCITFESEIPEFHMWNRLRSGIVKKIQEYVTPTQDPYALPDCFYELVIRTVFPILTVNNGMLADAMLERLYNMTDPDSKICAGKDDEYYRRSCALAKWNFPFYKSIRDFCDSLKEDANGKIELFLRLEDPKD